MKLLSYFFHSVIIFWSAQIIFAWILSVFEIYNVKYVLLFTLILCSGFLYSLYKKRELFNLYSISFTRNYRNLNKLAKIIITTVGLLWIFFFLYTLIFIFLSPAVNWDSLTYHLTKAAVANQTGTWWYHPEVSVARVNIFGSNASILDGVAFSLLGKDYLVELPQSLSALLIPITLFYIGTEIFKKRKIYAFIATLSVITIPLYLYESKTTQNDLVFIFALLLSIILVFSFARFFSFKYFVFVLLSLGILIGIKHHGIIASGVMGLFILYIIFKNRKQIRIVHFFKTLLIAPIVILLAFPSNIIGGLYYNSIFALDSGDAQKVVIGLGTVWENIKHFGYWFYFRAIGDRNYFSFDVGHAGFLNMVAIPLFISISIKNFLQRDLGKLLFIATITGTAFILFLVSSPDEWDLRLLLFLPVSAVYVTALYLVSSQIKLLRYLTFATLFLLALFNLAVTFYYVDWEIIKFSTKSLIRGEGVMSIGDYYYTRYMTNIYEFEQLVQNEDLDIILVGQNDTPLYPYYGEGWQNNVNYKKLDMISNEFLNSNTWDYLIIYHYQSPNLLERIEEMSLNYPKLTSDYYVNIYINEKVN